MYFFLVSRNVSFFHMYEWILSKLDGEIVFYALYGRRRKGEVETGGKSEKALKW